MIILLRTFMLGSTILKTHQPLSHTRTKTLWVFALALFVIFFFMSWSSYQVAQRSISRQIEENSLPLTSDNIYSQVQHDLMAPTFVANLMAHDTFVRDWALKPQPEEAPIQRYLAEIDRRFNTQISFFVLDSTGMMYLPDEKHHVVHETHPRFAWYNKVKSLPDTKPYLVTVLEDPEHAGKIDIFIDRKVFDYNDHFIGVAGVGLSIKKVHVMLAHYEKLYDRTIYFTDLEGNVVLHGKSLQSDKPLHETSGIKDIATKLLSSPSGSYHFYRNDRKIYVNARFIPEFDWYLLVEEHEDTNQSAVFNNFLLNVSIAVVVTLLVLSISIITQRRYHRKLTVQATFDPLTKAYNRSSGDEYYRSLLLSCHHNKSELSIVVVDIDHFKVINDTFGHDSGDLALKQLTTLVRDTIECDDVLCRWGGEEFVILLPHRGIQQAYEMAERVRLSLQDAVFKTDNETFQMTISGGVAQSRLNEELVDVVKRADKALYLAKEKGRNMICLADGV